MHSHSHTLTHPQTRMSAGTLIQFDKPTYYNTQTHTSMGTERYTHARTPTASAHTQAHTHGRQAIWNSNKALQCCCHGNMAGSNQNHLSCYPLTPPPPDSLPSSTLLLPLSMLAHAIFALYPQLLLYPSFLPCLSHSVVVLLLLLLLWPLLSPDTCPVKFKTVIDSILLFLLFFSPVLFVKNGQNEGNRLVQFVQL